jgi:hypothetical protein
MSKIIRKPHRAHGGITPTEKARMDEHARLWISRALRTAPIEPDKIIPAIHGIYAAAGLKPPRVVIVPSPLVMAFAYGAAAAIWHDRGKDNATDSATYNATANATDSATYNATANATHNATDSATDSATANATANATHNATANATYIATANATRNATDSATDSAEELAALACERMSGRLGLECAKRWGDVYQGGNMWAGYDCYLTACRDILGLELKEHAAYAAWEQAAIHGGFRVMHEEFCIVSDFPEIIKMDDQNRPHCETGPSHKWRDGWSLYHWHGVKVPAHWIEDRGNLDPSEIIRAENVEQRAAGAAIVGWPKMLGVLKAKTIDKHENPEIGELIELRLPGLDEPGLFLKAECPRNGLICEGVPRVSDIDGLPIKTAIAAQAWRLGDPASEFQIPPRRT